MYCVGLCCIGFGDELVGWCVYCCLGVVFGFVLCLVAFATWGGLLFSWFWFLWCSVDIRGSAWFSWFVLLAVVWCDMVFMCCFGFVVLGLVGFVFSGVGFGVGNFFGVRLVDFVGDW